MIQHKGSGIHPGKLILILLLTFCTCSVLPAQTLFTCDGASVSKADFLKAYNKNNNDAKATDKSYRDYLELYIRYKLKVRAAYAMQLDTLRGLRAELQSFRDQIAGNYLRDDASLEKLTTEAFNRGQHDLRLAHIFIAIPRDASPADTAKAYERAWKAYNALKAGKKFRETAIAFSDDPAVRQNGGEIGYISVFTLPYELETLAYSTPVGQFPKPYRSKAGYHIFRTLGERKSLGKIKVAQILLSIPPGAPDAVRNEIRMKADSLYGVLLKGGDFANLAKLFSSDNLTYLNGGEMPDFGVGKYDSAFEAAAFGLDKDGAISRPVLSPFGYHIVKRIYRKPFPRELTRETAATLKQEISADPRIEVSRKALLNRIWQQTGFRRSAFSEADLWAFTDSAMTDNSLSYLRSLGYATVLFAFPRQSYTVKDWIGYARPFRNAQPGRRSSIGKELFAQYVEKISLDYYRAHLEEYNNDFAFQLTEFREGNLLFEVMQRKIWDKASTDSAGLRNYFESHKDKYWWNPSADAILFTCNDGRTAQNMKSGLETNRSAWKQLADSASGIVQADSGRYEFAQIPGSVKTGFFPGMFTALVSNKADNTVSFAYILNVYNEKAPRNFKEARGFVINDYQNFMEDQWIAGLRKKYPVSIDERVFASLPK